MSWRLRKAGVDDLDAIMAIEESVFVNDAWSAASMRAELLSGHTEYLVAFSDEATSEVSGYAGMLAPRGGRDADIQTIAVVPSARRGGLGRMLMLALLDHATSSGIREVFLEVRADNPAAITLYTSLGFAEIGIRPKYYQPDGIDAIVMKLDIPLASRAATEGGRV